MSVVELWLYYVFCSCVVTIAQYIIIAINIARTPHIAVNIDPNHKIAVNIGD